VGSHPGGDVRDGTTVKHYSRRQIQRTLRKFDTREAAVEVTDDVALRMVEIADAYALLDRLLEREDPQDPVTRFPYWAEIWPASLALARWFLSVRPPPPTGITLELGCGMGLVGVALAKLGWRVQATDFVEDALVLSTLNARNNRVASQHQVSYLDWKHPVGAPTDCVVASDVAYEKQAHPYLARVIGRLLLPGGRLYMSDPRRPVSQTFFATLECQGYSHEVESVSVRWRSLGHEVDIHRFVRPDRTD